MKLSHVVEELFEERGLSRETLITIVCEGLQAAYGKKYPHVTFSIEYDKKTGNAEVFAEKKVVSAVEDEDVQISLRRARAIDSNVQLDDTVKILFDGQVGRIEILRAKQVIAQKIRAIEAQKIYEEFKPKEGTIVLGSIYKAELSGVMVKIGSALAFLPKSLMIPGDTCVPGYAMRALLKEVLLEPRNDNQLILDRRSPQFLAEFFKSQIPEIYDGVVTIKRIARIAGYKSKVIVTSKDVDVDPVGACIGAAGIRIKPMLADLGTEKVDVLSEGFSREDLVRSALKPAVVRRVAITDGIAQVWLDSDQRSLAIGKMGQNITLASELCELEIQLMDDSSLQTALEHAVADEENNASTDLVHDEVTDE